MTLKFDLNRLLDKLETSDELKKVGLSLLTNEYCDRIIRRNRYWDGFVPSQMCAGELAGGKDTCQVSRNIHNSSIFLS